MQESAAALYPASRTIGVCMRQPGVVVRQSGIELYGWLEGTTQFCRGASTTCRMAESRLCNASGLH